MPDEPPRTARPSPAGRVGWPGAAPGTPASRLRLPVDPVLPLDGLEDSDLEDDLDDHLDDGDLDGPPDDGDRGRVDEVPDDRPATRRRGPPGRPSAWSTASAGERLAQRWLPESLRGARLDPGRLGALALAAVAVIAAVVVGAVVWGGRPTPEPVPALPVIGGAPSTAVGPAAPMPAPAAAPAGPMIVSVAGKVTRPGLVRLPEGSRVGEAVEAAGGALPGTDLTALNLAARLNDGEQVLVGVEPPSGTVSAGAAAGNAAPAGSSGMAGSSGAAGAAAPAGSAASAAGAPGGKLNLNAATLEQLDQLPGVGPVTAKKILDWRTQNGRFAAVEQLQEISGIGDARFATLRDVVTV